MPKGEHGTCVVEETLALLSGRYRAEILKLVEQRPAAEDVHFNELKRLTGASAHTLTRTLRALQDGGLLTSHREATWGRNFYRLTDKGRDAIAVLDRLAQLGG